MKTKIIYISGSEVFEMADIRAAFDSVRATLGLGNDTILFGVPVDTDNALAQPENKIQIDTTHTIPEITSEQSEPEIETIIPIPAVQTTEIADMPESVVINQDPVDEFDDTPNDVAVTEDAPVKKSRGRPRKVMPVAENVPTADDDVVADAPAAVATDTDTEHKVIQILSVLAAKKDTAVTTDESVSNAIVADATDEIVTDDTDNNVEISDDDDIEMTDDIDIEMAVDDTSVDIDDEIKEDDTDTTATVSDEIDDEKIEIDVDAALDIEIENVEIDDMVATDVPEQTAEKTLEELLESMEPLREDIVPHAPITSNRTPNVAIAQDSDATLEQLATEFAANQDKIISSPSAASHGKIGKLKNILPFKKARRDDGGLMGDLFGWAGVAANDDDFAIPGFFTTAASKK